MEGSERTAGRQRDPGTDVALIEAVLDLVSAGATLSGLSLVEIAKHAGVSRNSLYRRWKTKDALYLDVLDSINRPLPTELKPTAVEDLAGLLELVVERTMDKRANRMLRALNAEAEAFPELFNRYYQEIVAPRREAVFRAIRRGVERGEIRPDVDEALLTDVLVAPILARTASGGTDDLDAQSTSRRITDLVFDGVRPR
jgi:AcrR family transcriptional regulator